jgi:hypothetical protein
MFCSLKDVKREKAFGNKQYKALKMTPISLVQ